MLKVEQALYPHGRLQKHDCRDKTTISHPMPRHPLLVHDNEFQLAPIMIISCNLLFCVLYDIDAKYTEYIYHRHSENALNGSTLV